MCFFEEGIGGKAHDSPPAATRQNLVVSSPVAIHMVEADAHIVVLLVDSSRKLPCLQVAEQFGRRNADGAEEEVVLTGGIRVLPLLVAGVFGLP